MDLYCLCDNNRYHKPYENSSYKNSYSSTTRATTESTTEVTTKTIERTTTSVTTREEPTTRAWNDNNSYKNNTLALQDSSNTKYYTVTIKGSEIVISSADSDSPEILHRVE